MQDFIRWFKYRDLGNANLEYQHIAHLTYEEIIV